jgi:hypothetical protein
MGDTIITVITLKLHTVTKGMVDTHQMEAMGVTHIIMLKSITDMVMEAMKEVTLKQK